MLKKSPNPTEPKLRWGGVRVRNYPAVRISTNLAAVSAPEAARSPDSGRLGRFGPFSAENGRFRHQNAPLAPQGLTFGGVHQELKMLMEVSSTSWAPQFEFSGKKIFHPSGLAPGCFALGVFGGLCTV